MCPVAGPILGGWISDNISWPWIFYVNIPAGVIAAIATFAIVRERDSVIRKAPIDTVGPGLLVIWVASLQIMLDKGKDLDWFNSTTIVVLTLIAVIALAFFIVWELTEEHPVIDLSLFKLRNFTGGTITLAVGYGLYFGNIVLLPLWLQNGSWLYRHRCRPRARAHVVHVRRYRDIDLFNRMGSPVKRASCAACRAGQSI